MTNAIRIIGLDPGLRRTGWGVIVLEGSRLSWLGHGVVTSPVAASLADRLLSLFNSLTGVLGEYAPHEAAVEETFVNTNAASTLKLGQARAISLLVPARAGLPVYEYAAKEVKKAVVGAGGADKDQVAFMVKRLLPTAGDVTADAADALACAITHANGRTLRLRGVA